MGQEFVSFDGAKKKVREAGIKSAKDYGEGRGPGCGLPVAPSRFYGDQWISWKDLLGL